MNADVVVDSFFFHQHRSGHTGGKRNLVHSAVQFHVHCTRWTEELDVNVHPVPLLQGVKEHFFPVMKEPWLNVNHLKGGPLWSVEPQRSDVPVALGHVNAHHEGPRPFNVGEAPVNLPNAELQTVRGVGLNGCSPCFVSVFPRELGNGRKGSNQIFS